MMRGSFTWLFLLALSCACVAAPRSMPDLTQKSREAALAELERLHLKARLVEVVAEGQIQGVVLRQQPSPGKLLTPEESIVLYLASPPKAKGASPSENAPSRSEEPTQSWRLFLGISLAELFFLLGLGAAWQSRPERSEALFAIERVWL